MGNIGKVLDDLGSSANTKALLTAMVTGDVLAGMDFDPTGAPTVNGGAQTFTTQPSKRALLGH